MNTKQRRNPFSRYTYLILFLLLFALIFIRYCSFGFKYYHQLDDYIQYHNYVQGSDLFGTIKNLGLLAARPLAGLADIFIWSHFFDNMLPAVAILSAMYAAAALLLQRVFNRHFGTGYVFPVVLTLLPLAIEGTYWVSASSRIVAGLFFAALALYFFDRWCFGGGFYSAILFTVCQLISYGFYEQSLIFSLSAILLFSALHFNRDKNRAAWGLVSLVNALIYFGFTSVFQNSAVYGSRLNIINPFTRYYLDTALPNVLEQFYNAFFKGGLLILIKGFIRGVRMLITSGNIIYPVAVMLLCAALFAVSRRGTYETKKPALPLCVGLILALAPISIFLILDNPWFSLRCTVMSFCGLALIADTLFSLCAAPFERHGKFSAVLALFALVCSIAAVSEIRDYRDTTAFDRTFVALLSTQLETDNRLDPNMKIAVLGVEPSYLPEQNFYYHEHIHGVTESDWALTGALEWHVGTRRPAVTPMPYWNPRRTKFTDFDAFYRYTGTGFVEIYDASMYFAFSSVYQLSA